MPRQTRESNEKCHPDLEARAESMGVRFERLHADLGARVDGLDLTMPLSQEQQQLLVDAWHRFDLLLFRGQELTPKVCSLCIRGAVASDYTCIVTTPILILIPYAGTSDARAVGTLLMGSY